MTLHCKYASHGLGGLTRKCVCVCVCVHSYHVTWSRSDSQWYDHDDAAAPTPGALLVDSYGSTSYSSAHLLRDHVTSGKTASRGAYAGACTMPRSGVDYLGLGGLVDAVDCPSALCPAQHYRPGPGSPTTSVSAAPRSRDLAVPDVTSARHCRLHLCDCPPTAAAV